MVEFDHAGSATSGIFSGQHQLVCSLDMVKDSRALTWSLAPGNTVLSPWEPDLRRYGPGQVVVATKHGDGFGGMATVVLHYIAKSICSSGFTRIKLE